MRVKDFQDRKPVIIVLEEIQWGALSVCGGNIARCKSLQWFLSQEKGIKKCFLFNIYFLAYIELLER